MPSKIEKRRTVLARDSIIAYVLSALYVMCYSPSLCPSVIRVDQSKTVELVNQFSAYGSAIPLVFAG